jgi:hypothetical protein
MRLPISTLGAILNCGAAGVRLLRCWLHLVRRPDCAVVVRCRRVCAPGRSMNDCAHRIVTFDADAPDADYDALALRDMSA